MPLATELELLGAMAARAHTEEVGEVEAAMALVRVEPSTVEEQLEGQEEASALPTRYLSARDSGPLLEEVVEEGTGVLCLPLGAVPTPSGTRMRLPWEVEDGAVEVDLLAASL